MRACSAGVLGSGPNPTRFRNLKAFMSNCCFTRLAQKVPTHSPRQLCNSTMDASDAGPLPLTLDAADLELVEEVLAEALEQVAGEQQLSDLQKDSLKASCERAVTALQEFVQTEQSLDEDGNKSSAAAAATDSPAALAEGSDDDLLHLHDQVQKASQRVAALRKEVPGIVLQAALGQLAAIRPAAATTALSDLTNHTAAGTAPDDNVPEGSDVDMAALRNTLAGALDKLPGLRARLDQAVQRLSRVVAAVEQDQSRPSPKTVERVLMEPGNRRAALSRGSQNVPHDEDMP